MKKKSITIITCIAMLFSIMSVFGWTETAHAASLYWPVPGHTSHGAMHNGNAIDITDGSINGANVYAAMGGKVTTIYKCGTKHYGSYGDCNGFGTGIAIKGDDGRIYQYAHMQAGSMPSYVYYGARINGGQLIGKVGTTGNSSGPHLHFGISYGNYWNASGINPGAQGYAYSGYSGGAAQSPAASISWGSNRCEPDSSNSFIYTKATAGYKGTYTQAGATIWDAAGNRVASKTENINTYSSYLEVWYNITNEMGVKLKSGTNYKYQYWVVFNGQKFTSPTMSFTTKGVPAISSVALSQTAYTFDNKVKTPSVTVMTTSGKLSSSNYTVSYPAGRKAVGKYTVKVTFKGNYSGSKSLSYTIAPRGVNISKISPSKKAMTVKWGKPSSTYRKQMTGYQVRYSTASNMANAKTATIKSSNVTSKKISGLKGKTKYYVQLRTYKTVKGINYYSGWSKVKTIVAK